MFLNVTFRPECEAQVKGFNGAIFKKFATKSQAEDHIATHGNGKQMSNPATKRSAPTEPTFPTSSFPAAKKAKQYDTIKPVAMKRHGQFDFMEDAEEFVQVYTDGSCEGNGTNKAIAGLGVYFAEGHELSV